MGHPQLWWLLIARRRDAQTFAVQKPRNEAIKQLILCPTIYVTPKPGVAVGTPVDLTPPARIRTCRIAACGSYLGCLASKRKLG